MDKSKLIDLLRSLDAWEWRSFRQMVESPYFNRNQDVQQLFEWLSGYAPEFQGLNRAQAAEQLFPEEGAAAGARLNHAMSFLLKLAEDFVGLEVYWNQKFTHPNNVLLALGKRDLEKHYRFHLEKERKVMSFEAKHDAAFFYGQYTLENYEAERFVRNAPRQFNESVQIATDSLDAFYLLEKLRRTCYMYTSQAILSTPYNLHLVEEVCRFVGSNLQSLAAPSIEAYYRVFQLLTREDPEADFQALKTLLAERSAAFTPEDLIDVYQYAINFCNIQIMQGKEAYVTEAFELYTRGVDSGILLESGILSPWHFKNIINLALKLEQFDWTAAFISANTRLLLPEFQTDALHYNFALLYFSTGRYGEALQHLNQVEFTDVHYSIGAKFMLCKIYFENDDYDALDSLLHSFNAYLRRNKLISENIRQAYSHFTQILKKTLRARSAQWPALKEEVEKTRLLAGKDWLVKILGRSV